jgi:hypothetical protein
MIDSPCITILGFFQAISCHDIETMDLACIGEKGKV